MCHWIIVPLSCPDGLNKFPIHYWISRDYYRINNILILWRKAMKQFLFWEGRIVHLPIKRFIVTLCKFRFIQCKLLEFNLAKTDIAHKSTGLKASTSVLNLSFLWFGKQPLVSLMWCECLFVFVRKYVWGVSFCLTCSVLNLWSLF